MKTGTIIKCQFKSQWEGPNMTLYYHELTLDNGDVGNCGTKEKYSDKIKEKTKIEYEIDDRGRITLSKQPQQSNSAPVSKQSKQPFVKKSRETKMSEQIGYVYSYAKDIVCAEISAGKKIPKPAEVVNKLANDLYVGFSELLKKALDSENSEK